MLKEIVINAGKKSTLEKGLKGVLFEQSGQSRGPFNARMLASIASIRDHMVPAGTFFW